MVVLVGLLAPVGVLASWNAIKERRKIFYTLFLVQQTAMFGVFVSLDLMVYYGFWELSLVPMAILIAMYGRKMGQRLPSSSSCTPSFLLRRCWSLSCGSMPAPALLISLNCRCLLPAVPFPLGRFTGWRWRFCLPSPSKFLSFRSMVGSPTPSVKRPPPWPWWLPASWVSIPCCAFTLSLFPAQARAIAPLLIALAVIGVLYGACLALVQRDFWRLLAFALLSHLSLITLGIYGLTFTGWDGAVYQILNNGVVDAALFLLLALLEVRYATSQIASYGGLAIKIPQTATLFVIASLAMIGLPMLNGFVGEFLILSSTFTGVSRGWTIAAALGVILGAAYMLWLVQRLFYGPETTWSLQRPADDLRPR